jgi:hypothetical protein
LGHFPKDCWFRKKYPRKGKHHASTVEDDESKRNKKSPSNEKDNRKEYYLVSYLSNSVSTGPKTWLLDSGASKHMTGYKEILSDFETKSFAEYVELGDEKCYNIEGLYLLHIGVWGLLSSYKLYDQLVTGILSVSSVFC